MMKKGSITGDEERGQVLYQTALLLLPLLALLGLLVDGGLMLANYRRAQLTADTAAQAASHAVSREVFVASNRVALAPEAAKARARYIIEQNGYAIVPGGGKRALLQNVTITVGPKGEWVRVTGRAELRTLFMRMFGIEKVRVAVDSVAYPAYGIRHEGE